MEVFWARLYVFYLHSEVLNFVVNRRMGGKSFYSQFIMIQQNMPFVKIKHFFSHLSTYYLQAIIKNILYCHHVFDFFQRIGSQHKQIAKCYIDNVLNLSSFPSTTPTTLQIANEITTVNDNYITNICSTLTVIYLLVICKRARERLRITQLIKYYLISLFTS